MFGCAHLLVHDHITYVTLYSFQYMSTCILVPSCPACNPRCEFAFLVLDANHFFHLVHLTVVSPRPTKFLAMGLQSVLESYHLQNCFDTRDMFVKHVVCVCRLAYHHTRTDIFLSIYFFKYIYIYVHGLAHIYG